jgi:hypothetical protein
MRDRVSTPAVVVSSGELHPDVLELIRLIRQAVDGDRATFEAKRPGRSWLMTRLDQIDTVESVLGGMVTVRTDLESIRWACGRLRERLNGDPS